MTVKVKNRLISTVLKINGPAVFLIAPIFDKLEKV